MDFTTDTMALTEIKAYLPVTNDATTVRFTVTDVSLLTRAEQPVTSLSKHTIA